MYLAEINARVRDSDHMNTAGVGKIASFRPPNFAKADVGIWHVVACLSQNKGIRYRCSADLVCPLYSVHRKRKP